MAQGEGTQTILSLLGKLRQPIARYLGDVPGLWWKMHNGLACQVRAPQQNAIDLDAELPGQAWELLDMKRYRAHNWHLWTAQDPVARAVRGNPCEWPNCDCQGNTKDGCKKHPMTTGGYASVQTSLGCSFRCSFCCIQAPFGDAAPRMRYWSPENVVGQIARLVNEYGITNIKIPDEMFCLNRKHVLGICDGIDRLGISDRLNVWAYARCDTVKDEEMLARMHRAGFRWLALGIESGSQHVRDGVEKGRFDGDDILRAVERVRAADLCVGANYIFGLPDDTRESMQETLDLACALNAEWTNFYCAVAYPGSALHAQVSRERPEALPENNPCGWIGYAQHARECLPLPTATLTAAQVLAFRDEAFMRYFSRDDYRRMIADRFGLGVVQEVIRMVAVGKPERDLLR